MKYLDQSDLCDNIIATYLLGVHYKLSNYEKAIDFFTKVVSSDISVHIKGNSNYPLEYQKELIYLAKEALADISHRKVIEEKNRVLNNLIAMFAHNFLGTLQCIRSNAEHDNNPNIHLKTVKMMGGALTAFSILSADDGRLIEQLKQDNKGETNLQQSLVNNLALAISQLLGKTNKDKIIDLYLQHF